GLTAGVTAMQVRDIRRRLSARGLAGDPVTALTPELAAEPETQGSFRETGRSSMRRFELHRDEDVSGVSGTGVVAEGVAFSDDGPVALRWTSEWPTSVVFHDRGVESLEAVHGHNGRTRIVWIDEDV